MSGPVEVDPWNDRVGGFIERHPRFVRRLADWESRLLRERLGGTAIDRPVYVAGIARSGSTILLELLARHPDVATHRYRDFPGVLAPVAWNWFVDRAARPQAPRERAHRDRIAVTQESPEAFEEPVWMAFFPEAHDPKRNAVLGRETRNRTFEGFYRDHVAKIVHLRGRSRYVAKGNYNLTRLAYLHQMFPDARFVVPVRDPVWHVASLMKQHRLFIEAGAADPAVTRSLRRSGHFEFGPDRRIVGVGRPELEGRIRALWEAGREAAGWACYWALLYGHALDTLAADEALAASTLIVRYEDLCASPAETMRRVLDHCGLPPGALPDLAAATVSAPQYYRPDFSPEELREIEDATRETARRLAGRAPPLRQVSAA